MSHRIILAVAAASCAAVLSVPASFAPVLADGPGTAAVTVAPPSNAHVDYGSSVTEATTLLDPATSTPVVGATVRLLGKVTGAPFREVASSVTDGTGTATVTLTPEVNTTYEWVFDGDADHAASTSARAVVKVAVVIEGAITKTHVKPHRTVSVFGVLHPTLQGAKVVLELQQSGGWTAVATTTVQNRVLPDGTSRVGFVLPFTTPRNGLFNLRVSVPVVPLLAKASPLRLQVNAY